MDEVQAYCQGALFAISHMPGDWKEVGTAIADILRSKRNRTWAPFWNCCLNDAEYYLVRYLWRDFSKGAVEEGPNYRVRVSEVALARWCVTGFDFVWNRTPMVDGASIIDMEVFELNDRIREGADDERCGKPFDTGCGATGFSGEDNPTC